MSGIPSKKERLLVDRIFWKEPLVSFAAVIRVVAQRFSPTKEVPILKHKKVPQEPRCATFEAEHPKGYKNLDEYTCPLYIGFLSPRTSIYVLLVTEEE